MFNRFLVLVLAVFLSQAVLAGCSTPGGKTVGEAVDDATIVAKVNIGIINDSELKFFRVDVASYRGVVTLTGRVDTKEQETRAIEIAQKVVGVKDVKSTLLVSPK